jgi:hypothetical protein
MSRTSSSWLRIGLALVGIFAILGLSGGLYVVEGMAVGLAVGICLVLAYGYVRRLLKR